MCRTSSLAYVPRHTRAPTHVCPRPSPSVLTILSLQDSLEEMSQSEKEGACLLSPTCVGIGANILATMEASGVLCLLRCSEHPTLQCVALLAGKGAKFSNLSDPASELDSFSMATVLGMLILDTFLYLMVTW